MSKHKGRKHYKQLPSGRFRTQLLAWPLFVIAATLLGWTSVPRNWLYAEVSSSTSYFGTLKSNASPTQITIPAGIAVAELLVKTGDKVRKGQTIVVFDEKRLREELKKVQAEANVLVQEQLCLDVTAEGKLEPEIQSSADTPICSEWRQSKTATTERFEAERERIEADILVISKFFEQADQSRKPPAATVADSLNRKLALSLTRHRLLEELAKLKARRSKELASDISRLAELKQKVRQQAIENHDSIRFLENTINAARLQSPIDGTVLSTRNLTLGRGFKGEVDALSIFPTQQQGFVAVFEAPSQIEVASVIGKSLTLKTIGLPNFHERLTAVVTKVNTANNQSLMLHAELSESSVKTILNSRYTKQIQTGSSSIQVELSESPVSLIDAVKHTLFESFVPHSSDIGGRFSNLAQIMRKGFSKPL